jgi:hypothetical protein
MNVLRDWSVKEQSRLQFCSWSWRSKNLSQRYLNEGKRLGLPVKVSGRKVKK